MFRRALLFAIVCSLFSLLTAPLYSHDAAMPGDPDRIAAALVKRGLLSPAAPPAEREAAIQSYLQSKADKSAPALQNPRARKLVDAREGALTRNPAASIRGRKLGAFTSIPNSAPEFLPSTGSGKLLLILVDFSDTPFSWTPAGAATRTAAGPLHNQIPVPDNNFDLWVPNFSTQHYEDMLFTPGGWRFPPSAPRFANQRRGSMHDYFLQQSYGRYQLQGKAYGWFTVNKPEAYYGDDNPAGGHDNRSPGTVPDLIQDAITVINASSAIPWSQYDTDGDCIIDHPLFIHAGADQSGGGGAQGDDAIWAKSSSTWKRVATTPSCPTGMYIYNYTIMPEDGGVGVFAHEFGHDLGLPDEYDTAYSGRGDSVAFWSLMSSGSWIGKPAQTQPPDMSIWARQALGWVNTSQNFDIVPLSALSSDPLAFRLEQSARYGGAGTSNALRISLPPKPRVVTTPHSGGYAWYGGKADLLDNTLRRTIDLTGKTSAALSFWTWYDIEPYWDYGIVQISTDGGATWSSLNLPGTTSTYDPNAMPTIIANLPGFTGASGRWQYITADLSAYAGLSIQLQFRYMTDWGTTGDGFYVDDITVTANGAVLFSDNAESPAPGWTANGWTRDAGTVYTNHYYILEWRNAAAMETPFNGTSILNFNEGLNNVYQGDPYGSTGNPNEPWWFSYAVPGLLLYYRDMAYVDNWTGAHPGHGYLLIVDAHKQATIMPPFGYGYAGIPWNTRVQSCDATFQLTRAPDFTIGYFGVTRSYNGLNAVPSFDDSQTHWTNVAPHASTMTPQYGLLFRLLGMAADGSAAVVGVGVK